MAIRNKVLVNVLLEDGCSQEDGEYRCDWLPVNFMIYSELFQGMVYEAVAEWVSGRKLEPNVTYELILAHVVEGDGGGAVHTEYFEVIHHEQQTF